MRDPHYIRHCAMRFHADHDENIEFNMTEVLFRFGLDPAPCSRERREFKYWLHSVAKGLNRKSCPISSTGHYWLNATPEQHTDFELYRARTIEAEKTEQIDRVEAKLGDVTLSQEERNVWLEEFDRLRRERRKIRREIKALRDAADDAPPEAEAA